MRFEDYKTLAFERRGKVLTIIINRPESYNSVNGDLHDELATVFSDVADDPDSDVIVLTGQTDEQSFQEQTRIDPTTAFHLRVGFDKHLQNSTGSFETDTSQIGFTRRDGGRENT